MQIRVVALNPEPHLLIYSPESYHPSLASSTIAPVSLADSEGSNQPRVYLIYNGQHYDAVVEESSGNR